MVVLNRCGLVMVVLGRLGHGGCGLHGNAGPVLANRSGSQCIAGGGGVGEVRACWCKQVGGKVRGDLARSGAEVVVLGGSLASK